MIISVGFSGGYTCINGDRTGFIPVSARSFCQGWKATAQPGEDSHDADTGATSPCAAVELASAGKMNRRGKPDLRR